MTSSVGTSGVKTSSVKSSSERQRSGGRSEQVRLAVGHAVLELLAVGRLSFTMVEVAERAGVNRRTLYRWWPTTELLLIEALTHHAQDLEVPDTGSWESDVREFARRIADFAAGPVDLSLTKIMVSGQYPGLNDAFVTHFGPIMTGWYAMGARAVDRGEATSRHHPSTVINTLVAPLFLAPLNTGRAAPREHVEQLVALLLDATRPGDGVLSAGRD